MITDCSRFLDEDVVLNLSVWSLVLFFLTACSKGVDADMNMTGLYGPYPMSREASGTSWQPDSSVIDAVQKMSDANMYMVDGFANVGYTDQGGPRGASQAFTTNMLMGMIQHPLDRGAIGFRGMMSLEGLMGKNGYPELFQTGETANGTTPLIDRQHPHDLFMELALTGHYEVSDQSSIFVYGGLPGEPALGPPAFMHRLSGEDNPEAPIGHHWMDSTHITYGVVTLGYTWTCLKLEGSAFRGREPDQDHWNIEQPALDSYSGRLSWNPGKDWSLQTSAGNLHSPEQLFPMYNTGRITASMIYNKFWSSDIQQSTTIGWGRNWQYRIDTLDAWLVESAFKDAPYTVFTRFETVQKDDLVPDEPLIDITGVGESRIIARHPFPPQNGTAATPYALNIFNVKRLTLGAIYDFAKSAYGSWGIGTSGSMNVVPTALQPFYGKWPLSVLLFLRLKIGENHAKSNLHQEI